MDKDTGIRRDSGAEQDLNPVKLGARGGMGRLNS